MNSVESRMVSEPSISYRELQMEGMVLLQGFKEALKRNSRFSEQLAKQYIDNSSVISGVAFRDPSTNGFYSVNLFASKDNRLKIFNLNEFTISQRHLEENTVGGYPIKEVSVC